MAAYWLFKSEPFKYSWDDLCRDGVAEWDGVRNYQARNMMREMKVGDRGFFYHSNEGKEIVGLVEVVKTAYPDFTFTPEPGKENPWEMVDIKPLEKMPHPVTLADVKANPKLKDMALVTKMRLSVQPVGEAEWAEVLRMAGQRPSSS